MSSDAQDKATKDLVSEIEELREMKKFSMHNVPLNSVNDASKNLNGLEKEVPNFDYFFLIF
jgi:hypothetical protein